MSHSLSIPTGKSDSPLNLTVSTGEMLFILGANGTGKSSLMQAFAIAAKGKTRRIAAHRQTWFASGAPQFSSMQRIQHELQVSNYDRMEDSRWKDQLAEQRVQNAIFDLVNAENVRARSITRAVDQGNDSEVVKLAAVEGAFTVLNRILQLANLHICVSMEANDEIVATRNGCKPYSIAKLSDGERNAILIAADVLTVPPDTLLLIDEPERHLHRSIISPLLSLLLKQRADCAFVVSTHEPLLAVDNPTSKVLLTRGCIYEKDRVASYDIDLLEGTSEIDDDLKRTILGERRKIVFVEGVEHSLDKPLYSLLFPNASIVAKASCREVEQAVVGIRSASGLHWVKAFGLVDNDSSDPERMAKLQDKGVVPIAVYSVESIYYHPDIQKLAGEKLAAVVGGDLEVKLCKAKDDALQAVQRHAAKLSQRIAEKEARAEVFTLLPKKGEIENGGKRTIEIDYQKFCEDESARLAALIEASDFVGILKRYPIRESGALDAIAKALNFAGRSLYEAAVQKILACDSAAVQRVRNLLGSLPVELVS